LQLDEMMDITVWCGEKRKRKVGSFGNTWSEM